MPKFRIAGAKEVARGVYYEFDSDDRPLGEGGMGKVYKGNRVDERSGQSCVVAVKFLKEEAANNPYIVEKARREAEMFFKHDNLVEMFGFVETENKSPYDYKPIRHYHVVSEMLVGVSLSDLFAGRLVDQWGNLIPYAQILYREYQQEPERFAIKIIKNVLSGLMCMHDAGCIHRDIDPSNIMITSDGKIKLIDYGIAKRINNLTTNDRHMTQAGEFVGKPEFAAPELILGQINEQNQTTDIYAVGILLFQCITGRLPFEGDRTDIIQMQLQKQPPLHLVKDKYLRKIIKRAMEKKRADRFQSSAEFRVALDGYVPPVPNQMWKYIISGALTVFIIIGIVIVIQRAKNDIPIIPTNDTTQVVAPVAPDVIETQKDIENVSEAIALLNDVETARKGYEALMRLSENDSKAAYILSRICFAKSAKKTMQGESELPDSIKEFQRVLSLAGLEVIDNVKANKLLKKAVKLDSKNFYAQYELGLDYWWPKHRLGNDIDIPDASSAEECFLRAKENDTQGALNKEITIMLNKVVEYYKSKGEKTKAAELRGKL